MTRTDTLGREYLKLSEAKEGIIELDAGFNCRGPGVAMLFHSDLGFYFMCECGEHYIDGQADDGVYCIGIYPSRD